MKVGVPAEVYAGERRVAATPDSVARLKALGFEVLIERGAGDAASFTDDAYVAAGAQLIPEARDLWAQADVILKVRPPMAHPTQGHHEADLLRPGQALISFIWPAQNPDLIDRLTASQARVWAMDAVPRISRAQRMDALSSMANIAGYRAVIEAAQHFGRFFTGQITAAGKVPPAKVLVIGAGVAGRAAIGAARGRGAIVRAFDTRPVVEEQVQSMGADFLSVSISEDGSGSGGYAREMSPAFIEAEMALFRAQAAEVDIIITTALIPGKPAPKLLPADVVSHLRPGSVVVDLAAEQGGNCAHTIRGQVTTHDGVSYVGYDDLPSRMASQSSQLYSTNLCHMLDELGGAAKLPTPDLDNEIIRGALITLDGALMWPAPARAPSPTAAPVAAPPLKAAPAPPAPKPASSSGHGSHGGGVSIGAPWLVFIGGLLALISWAAPPSLLSHLTVFVLACFVGWQLIWNVSPALHTPLMSVTNAISGIILIAGLAQVRADLSSPATILGAVAILVAMINVAGGFLVTQRMLKMFRR
jgi:H+-translocating NAD(P) transhydrogenase subunit alpha